MEFVQCSACMRWRKVPSVVVRTLPENWVCKLNGDPFHNKCSHPEETPEDSIPIGKKTQRKDTRTTDQKHRDLLEDIGVSRDKFSRTDRKKERELKDIERLISGHVYHPSCGTEVVGKRIRIFWRVHNDWFQGKIISFNSKKGTHKVHYDDGDEEDLKLDDEDVDFFDKSIPAILQPKPRDFQPTDHVSTKRLISVGIQTEPVNVEGTQKQSFGKAQNNYGEQKPVGGFAVKLNQGSNQVGDAAPPSHSTLEALRTSVKRFLQLQYPQGSRESESKGDSIDVNFYNHVQNMESELTFDLNL